MRSLAKAVVARAVGGTVSAGRWYKLHYME